MKITEYETGRPKRKDYDPDEARDWHGRWSRSGGSAGYEFMGAKFKPADAKAFVKAREKVNDNQKKFMTMHTAAEFAGAKTALYLSKDGKTGFGIQDGDELVNLFNVGERGAGKVAALLAIKLGARRLDYLDIRPKGLREFYRRLGFRIDLVDKNWTPGEPDVLFMSIPKETWRADDRGGGMAPRPEKGGRNA